MSAMAATAIVIYLAGKPVSILQDTSKGLFISESCRAGEKFDCDAWRALQRASIRKIRPESLTGGANPGAVLCGELAGKVVLAVDSKKNTTSYCQFEDGSVAASGSLIYYARKNDK